MFNTYSPQANLDRINNHIAELEKMKQQLTQQPPITQNFQITPNGQSVRYSDSLESVEREYVTGDTPFFSKDLSVLWFKNASGEVKTYELKEIIKKDEKDLQIEYLMAQIEEMKGMIANAKSSNADVDEPTESKKSANVSVSRTSKKK